MNEPARPLRILTLAGGPDRERPVSLQSGSQVADALRQAGHEVLTGDILPDDLSMLDRFMDWQGDVIFPVLHGTWGEGGGLQAILDDRLLRYVGSTAPAARLCMDKHRTKEMLLRHGLPTPPAELLRADQPGTLTGPVVIKPPREGSSIDLAICHDDARIDQARQSLHARHPELLVERYIQGKELTVGVIPAGDGAQAGHQARALPPIHIVPAVGWYDYEAKYTRQDTQYRFEIDLPAAVVHQLGELALQAHELLGCRHLSRVDFMVDREHRPWILEVNTIPGFTTHSLLPMAARQAGLPLPALVDLLVRAAL